MGKVIQKDSFDGQNQYVFIGLTPIPLVQSFNTSNPLPSTNSAFLGERNSHPLMDGSFRGQASLSCLLLTQDYLYPLTGSAGSNIYLVNNIETPLNGNHAAIGSYLTNYSNSYGIDTIPSVTVNFDVFNGIRHVKETDIWAAEVFSLNYQSTGTLNKIGFGCATVTLDSIQNCPIISYSINASCPRNPIYPINKRFPSNVYLGEGELSVSFQMERSSYETFDSFSYPIESAIKDFNIVLNDKNNNPYNTYVFNDMILESTNLDSRTDNPDIISVSYRRKI